MLQQYSKSRLHNYVTPKIGLLSGKFSYDPREALSVGRVANILLTFSLEIDYNKQGLSWVKLSPSWE